MTHHVLKSFPPRFSRCTKDRTFRVGDTVELIEGWQEKDEFIPTGRTKTAIISCVDTFALPPDHVTLSYKKLGVLIV